MDRNDTLKHQGDALVWLPELGMGYHTAEAMSYEEDYWKKYQVMDDSGMGEMLTQARIDFVRKHYDGLVCDIGIGAGRFVEEIGGLGFDVNEHALAWLEQRNRFCDPYRFSVRAITCWDSLEHITKPEELIAQAEEWVFVSMPIYKDGEHVLKSKHYRPGEHLWYWTREGLIKWFFRNGFNLISSSDFESEIGREDIESFAFHRFKHV